MINLIFKLGFLCAAIILLPACGNSKFDCPIGKSIFCKPVSQVDQMADQGHFSGNHKLQAKKSKQHFKRKHKTLKAKPLQLLSAIEHPPERIPDQVLQVWVAPYETSDGVYHQPARMNVVVQKGFWADKPFQYEDVP